MVGQENLKQQISNSINNFPRFSILTGPAGSKRTDIASYTSKALKANLIEVEGKVGDVRNVLKLAYKQTLPTLYVIVDGDNMSNGAKNALLKVTEEPPQNAYFMLILEDMGNTLPTLKSRGTEYRMDNYKPDEILEYWHSRYREFKVGEMEIVSNLCTVPGDCDIIERYNIKEFNDYINSVMDNIAVVNGANAFKISKKFKIKKDGEGYDAQLFMAGLIYNYSKRYIKELDARNYESMKVCVKYKQDLKHKSVSKQMTLDMWILEMRGVWL